MSRGFFEKLAWVRQRVAEAARSSGRSPEAVELMAVTKHASAAVVRELLAQGGLRHLGENRVQDAAAKLSGLSTRHSGLQLHLIGHLQSNKSKRAAALFDWIDSLDGRALAERLERDAEALGKTLKVMVQVQATPNPRQSGAQPEELPELLKAIRAMPHLELRGLMAIAPVTDPVEAARPHFRALKAVFDGQFAAAAGDPAPVLSMGMSRDFEVAVAEGATMVRIGSLLFEDV